MWKRFRKQDISTNSIVASHPRPHNHLIELRDVVKAYQTPVGNFIALDGVTLTIDRGEFVAVVGKSGSGKSTMINMITGIDRPSSGEILVDGLPVHTLKEGPMAQWRGRNIGVIFQFFQLLPMLSILENVILPMDFCKVHDSKDREAIAMNLLEQVDMADQAHKLPSEVSGGQQQRAAIARALANDPPILVADEPTGNLDSRSAIAIFELFHNLVDSGKTILMVTHDNDLARRVGRTVTLADGSILNEHLTKVFPMLTHDLLLKATRQIQPQTYQPGNTIIQAGDLPDKFYLVTAGQADVLVPDGNGDQKVVAHLQTGQYFGEIAILNGSTRMATVKASGETAVNVVALEKDTFHNLVGSSPAMHQAVSRVADQRVKAASV
ncbi:MAG: ATP-binding cassette domain-containing protein [Anaerolineae bacterium]|nr:ATP-binding cassette domain-containing protein [Anaerolineae bacterium]